MIAYPVEIRPDGDQFLVRFPDVPEAISFGETESDAFARAVDALETALVAYVEAKRPLPSPSGNRGPAVSVSALAETKLTLHALMLERDLTDRDLARRLGVKPTAIRRLLDLRVESPLNQIEAAFRALDRRLSIQVVDAA
jgi:antitoxin HicB